MNDSTSPETAPASRGPARLAPLLITIFAGAACYGLFVNRGAWLSVIGFSVAPAERVMQGEVPYRDFLYNYTPGVLWLNALLMKVFGANLLAVNAGIMLFKMGALLALFAAARRLTNGWVALVPVALTLSWLGYKYIYGVVPAQYSLLFLLMSLICALKWNESERLRWLFLGGLAAGLVTVFKHNVGVFLTVAGLTALLIRFVAERKRAGDRRFVFRSLAFSAGAFLLGIAVTVGAMAAYLYFQGALGAMVDHFLHHARYYAEARSVPLPGIKWLAPVAGGLVIVTVGGYFVLRRAERFFIGYLAAAVGVAAIFLFIPVRAYKIKTSASASVAYLPVLLLGGIAIVLGILFFWKRARESEAGSYWERHSKTIIVALFALATWLEVYPRADYYHLIRVLPPVFLLGTLVVYEYAWPVIAGRTSASVRRNFAAIAIAVLALFIIVGIKDTWQPHFDSRLRFVDRTTMTIERASGMLVPPKQKEFAEQLADLIESNSSPEDYIFSFSQRGTGFYFLSARRNPTRFVWWRTGGIREEDRNEVLRMLDDRKAKLVVLQDSLKDPRVRDRVSSSYEQIGAAHDLAVYARRP